MIACKVTLTTKNTGYNLLTLVQAAYTALNFTQDQNNPPRRFTSITIQLITGGAGGWIVPTNGAYANTANVPDQYGYDFANSGAMFDKSSGFNDLSLSEINLGSDTDGCTFAVLVFTA
jgi:hypothetical protein